MIISASLPRAVVLSPLKLGAEGVRVVEEQAVRDTS
jgi:hypothetical protein